MVVNIATTTEANLVFENILPIDKYQNKTISTRRISLFKVPINNYLANRDY
ncbi:hypothetical protein H1P_770025 [Hyella patelloides LEGE 07179]|uniref:Uncharacterized protein n=1 Tax=Hyella patelloides LEGE 07179 TaxID=945734 RepID=A0A563W3Y3_9CYAN|nr:hypothetical protein H1P_770025 [Hyella patelloides LEGE 07179]